MFDLAIIGSGFAGSLLAMVARRLGKSVVMIERGRHPRFAIGESSTPLTNLLLEELATRYDLPRLLPLTKWGMWQRTYPEITCGLKRGFSFYHHVTGERWTDDEAKRNQLLVAASPRDEIADTHWLRAEFDHFLVREAQAMGAELWEGVELREVGWKNGVVTLSGDRQVHSRCVIDASGPRGFLHRALGLKEKATMATQALYTHFAGVRRFTATDARAPFPADDAALHHVFAGGWVWVLRFNNGLTSAGVAATPEVAGELRLAEGAPGWKRLLEKFPSIAEQFADAEPTRPFVHLPRMAFRSSVMAGEDWAMLPSAAGFVDPLLSTGFPLTLLGITRIAKAWERGASLEEYARLTERELDVTEDLISALYAQMHDFAAFAALTRLYFAAASFAEAARRLGRASLAGGFLMYDHPRFGPRLRELCADARAGRVDADAIRRAIEPLDVAGLSDAARGNWHPCLGEDLLAAAPKLGASREEVLALLARCGFTG